MVIQSKNLAWALKQGILNCDPYEGFDYKSYPNNPSGGEDDPIFEELIKNMTPTFIVEVGSWKGRSAIRFADLMKKYYKGDFAILCIDTWLGSDPVHQWTYRDDPTWGMQNMYDHGFPTIYKQFLANVCYAGHTDVIVPFPQTSSTAVEWIRDCINVKPAFIYIDGNHNEEECYLDVKRYYDVLDDGGTMLGDDYHANWAGVICAVNKFANERGLKVYRSEQYKWLLQKLMKTH